MRRWGIDPQASLPSDELLTPPEPPFLQNAQQHNVVATAQQHNVVASGSGAPSFVLQSHDDPIELQLKELRLQQQHRQRQKKPPKQPTLHVQLDAEPLAAATHACSSTSSPKSSAFKPPKTTKPSAALSEGAETSVAAASDAAAIKSGKSKPKKASNPLLVVPASAADCAASSDTTKVIHSARAKQPKESNIQHFPAESKWAVGTPCSAKYAADGKFYAAEVVQVIGQSIIVSFTEYEDAFQTCLAKDIRAVVPKGSARGHCAKVETPILPAASEHAATLKKQSERPSSAQAQPKQLCKKESSLTLSAEPKQHQQKLPFNASPSQHSHAAPSRTLVQQKNTKTQMPDHSQEWEKASAAALCNPSATDSNCASVALSSVGLVAPLAARSLGMPSKAAATPQQAPAPPKLLSAFDLAKARADERAAAELQQVKNHLAWVSHFFPNCIYSFVRKSYAADLLGLQQLQKLPRTLPSLLLLLQSAQQRGRQQMFRVILR